MKEFENFISYRRSETMVEVKNIYDSLKERGFSTFCDIYSLDNGNFGENILETINNCTNFILVVNNRSFDRCTDSRDWLYKEIYKAIEEKKNIVCVFVGDVLFPEHLPNEISPIKSQNSVIFNLRYYDSFIDELTARFLVNEESVTVSDESRDFIIDNGVLLEYIGNASVVNIPSSVIIIGSNAFKDKTRMSKVIFSDNVEVIQDNAFHRCIGLNNIKLSTNVRVIEKKAFIRCSNLTYIELNSKLEKICEEAFSFCSKLKWIKITSNVNIIHSSAFNGCSKLSKFEVEKSNSYFTSVNGMLMDYDKATMIRCPENYSHDIISLPETVVTLEEWSFSKCINIVDLKLPRSLEYIKAYAFKDSYNIGSITLPDSIREFNISAIDGWTVNQRIVFGKKVSPKIKYNIEKKIKESQVSERSVLGCEYILVKTTFESQEEAEMMAKMLLNSKHVVSGQISELKAMYLWEGTVNTEHEYELSCITESSKCYEVESFICNNHSYELCEILVVPVIHTTEAFGKWISDSIYKKRGG